MGNKNGHHWITDKRRRAIYERDENTCIYCRRKLPAATGRTLDHLQPRSLGGSNASTNLVTACVSCNSRRRNESMRTFFALLRGQGVDTKGLSARIRRQVARPCSRGPAPVVMLGLPSFVWADD